MTNCSLPCTFLPLVLSAAVLTLGPRTALAQGAESPTSHVGRIVGRIVDAQSGQGISDVGVQVVGTTLGTVSGVDGRFVVPRVPAGTVTLQARRLGFQPKTVTGLMLESGRSLEQNITLTPASVQLSATVVTASAEKGTVSEALDKQRTAVEVVSSVTAEQIAKTPDGNAAQAVERVSGVSVTDGKYVFVRGLGERYTTTQLNGARVPSPEPEKRVVPLDMFPSGLLQEITTTKTFTPDQQGDFSGALVNIRTREFPARRAWSMVVNSGYAGGATGSRLPSGLTTGGEQFAMVRSARDLPLIVRQVGNFQGLNLTQSDKNLLISQFRDAWTPKTVTAAPLASGSVSLGGNDPLLFGHQLGYLLSGTFSSGMDAKSDQVRALADRGNVKGDTKEIDRFTGSSAGQSVLWGGLANLSTMLGAGSRLSFNGMYNRTADNDARIERGHFENEGIDAQITRMDYVERAVRSAQLSGEHQFGTAHRFDWAATVSGVNRDEPDRSEFVQQIVPGISGESERLLWLNTSNGGAVRTFSSLGENSKEGRANYQLTFSGFGREHSVKVGGLTRTTMRNADTRAYAIEAPGASDSIRALSPEELFDGRFTQPGSTVFDIAPVSEGGSYGANDRLAAGYAMSEVALSSRFRLIGGARYESDHLVVHAASTIGTPVSTTKQWNDWLPSVALNVKLNEAQQLRFSASRTLARPEYRELSPITSRDVLNGDDTQGNDQLRRTNILNFDSRWEWYPNPDQVFSVALFAKRFDHPIERVYQASGSGTRVVFYTNAARANNYGVEVEARKNLGFVANALQPLTLFSNVTVMQSQIELDKDTQASATNLKRRMVGQAPYVINAGLSYLSNSGKTSATALFNRAGDRIDAAGDAPLPDVVESARNVFDVSFRFPLAGALSGRFDAKNLLDAPYRTVQGTVGRDFYRAGRTAQLGLMWRP
jgi:outer membrane receptor protein involved in Fe transport